MLLLLFQVPVHDTRVEERHHSDTIQVRSNIERVSYILGEIKNGLPVLTPLVTTADSCWTVDDKT